MKNKCRKTKSGKYEAYTSIKGKTIHIGTFQTEEEAKQKLIERRINIFENAIKEYNLTPSDCKLFEEKFLVFPTGEIFNCYGKKIIGHINRDGYLVGTLNNKFYQFHRVVAICFLPKINGKEFVNHKDGNKSNNNVNNLEWCTRSENTLHSFRNYLQDNITNQYGNFSVISEKDILFVKDNYWKTQITANVLSQYFKLSKSQIQKAIYEKHKNKLNIDDEILYIWHMKSSYEKLGKEIGKCSRSIRHIVNKIGKDFNYEIFKHISNELRKQF